MNDERAVLQVKGPQLAKVLQDPVGPLGVPADYIEYMMGHTISTYHDVQMKGVEFLRNIYAASGLSIKPNVREGSA